MGYIGLLVTLGIVLLGGGYFFFGSSGEGITAVNDTPQTPLVSGLAQYENAKEQALNAKVLVEQKVAETMAAASEPAPVTKPAETPATTPAAEPAVTAEKSSLKITNRLVGFGFSSAQHRTIDTIVLHSSYDASGADPYSVAGVIAQWRDYQVAPHYMIDRNGAVSRLVEDQNISYHAGVSKMPDGRKNVNDFSIGIEMLNTKTGQYTAAQYTAVNDLIAYLKGKYPIKYVVGHADIAPDRKTDPWNFNWKKLR